MAVDIEIQNVQGQTLATFPATQGRSFVEMAEEAWLQMPTSCCSGACFVCACRIKEWAEHIDIGLLSVPLVDIDADQVLTCVGGVRDSLFLDAGYHKIILQKLM